MIRAVVLAAFLISMGLPLRLLAQEIPSWVLKQPSASSSEIFYVGSSEGAATYGEAIENASKSAMEKAIRENFGVDAQLESKFFETSKSTSITSTLNEKSKRVRIEGFETRDSFITNGKNGWSAFVLFAYQKAEISVEKKRLKALGSQDAEIAFSEIGNPLRQSNGRLEIVSDPPGATVFIDGKDALSKTPIRLSGILDTGKHSVIIDHPDYQSVSREIIITPGEVTSVNETLIPATGYLSITSTFPGTVVLADGKTIGSTPINHYKVPANHRIKIDFIHPDAYKTSTEISVSRDEDRRLFQPQQALPAQLQVSTLPPQANILLDGRTLSKGWISVDPGTHTVVVSQDGFRAQTKVISLRGGEKRIETVTLMNLSEEERLRQENQEKERDRIENKPWIFSMGLSSFSDTVKSYRKMTSTSLDFGLEKKLSKWVGLKFSLNLLTNDESADVGFSDGPRRLEGTQYELNLPFYMTRSFYFGPGLTKVKTDVTCTGFTGYGGSKCVNYSADQQGSGFVIGYQFRVHNVNLGTDNGSFDIFYNQYKYADTSLYKGETSGRIGIGISIRY